MAKRFTDTEKWRDEWFGSLPNDYRIVWQYMLDTCSIAGIWKKDFRGLNFNCNTKISEQDFSEIFKGRVIQRPAFFFIPKFLRFQYPTGLNSNKPMIVSVVRELDSFNLSEMVNQLFGNDYLIIKDKIKINVMVKDKDSIELSIFSDVQFMEQLARIHKGKDLKKAFGECYMHHSNSKSVPGTDGEWKQKFNSWLANTKVTHVNGSGPNPGKI